MTQSLPNKLATKATLILSLSFALAAPAIAGERYTGKWNGKIKSKIEILDKDPLTVKYCFANQRCSTNRPNGSLKKMIFAWPKNGNFPGADMVLKQEGNTYRGTYQQHGSTQVSTIVFKRRK